MIETEIDGAIARITLNRPEKHNAPAAADLHEFRKSLERREKSPDLRCLIVTGAGERTFCSGVALGDVASENWDANPLTALCDALEDFPAPTVAALNGGVYGGGVEIALSCDFRIGVEGMRLFAPPARIGVHYEPAGLRRAVGRLGPQVARRVYLAAETFEGAEVLRLGFVDRLVPAATLATTVAALADTLAGLAPLAVRGMKRTINEIARDALDEAAARERVAACWR